MELTVKSDNYLKLPKRQIFARDQDQDQDRKARDQDQDQDWGVRDQDQDQAELASSGLETKTAVSRTTTLCIWTGGKVCCESNAKRRI